MISPQAIAEHRVCWPMCFIYCQLCLFYESDSLLIKWTQLADEKINWWDRVIQLKGWLTKVVFIFGLCWCIQLTAPNPFLMSKCVHVCMPIVGLPGRAWNAAVGFNWLFGWGRFSSPATHTFKSAQKLAGGEGSPISMVKWHLSTRLLTGWLGGEAQGPGEGAGSTSTAVFYGGTT